jgi:uncharacterized protein
MRLRHILALALLEAGLTGCSAFAPRPDQTRLLLLTPIAPAASNSGPSVGAQSLEFLAIGLGPIKMPQYLDRPELVTRTSPNGIELSNNERWAEPLSDNFRHVLARDLTALLGTTDVVPYPWYAGTKLDYIVRVDVERFDADTSGAADLTARWELAAKNGAVLAGRQSQFSQQANALNGDAAAAALSADLGELAKEVASAIAQAEQQRLARRQN